jgi:hypothetical protein
MRGLSVAGSANVMYVIVPPRGASDAGAADSPLDGAADAAPSDGAADGEAADVQADSPTTHATTEARTRLVLVLFLGIGVIVAPPSVYPTLGHRLRSIR